MDYIFDGPAKADRTVVLAHGAGQGMDSPFMAAFAGGLAAAKLRVARFEFPYMARSRASGKRKAPDRLPVLRETWLEAIEALGGDGLVIGGKSMGGRIASTVADEVKASGLVCLGYPFHPPGKPDRTRVEHLKALQTPALILQGTRDAFGTPDDVDGYELSNAIQVRWMEDGDHSFKPRKKSGRTTEDNWAEAIAEIVAFVERLK